MGCIPKFNSIPLAQAVQTVEFGHGILNLNFKYGNSWEEICAQTVEWVTKHIKGRPTYLTDNAGALAGVADVHQLWPSADEPDNFTTDLVNTYRNIFDLKQPDENGDVDNWDNGDEYVVILVSKRVDLRLISRVAKDIRPAVFVTVRGVFHGNHNRFMSRWSMDLFENQTGVMVRNISGQSGVTIQF